MTSGEPPLLKRRRRVRRSTSCAASRGDRPAAILRRPKFPGSRSPVRAICVTPVRRRVGAQDAGQGRSRPQAQRCCSGPRCLLRFSRLKQARPEHEATSRSRPSSRSWGLRSCKLPFMLTPRLPPRPRRGPRSRRRPSWRRRRLSGRRPRRWSRRSERLTRSPTQGPGCRNPPNPTLRARRRRCWRRRPRPPPPRPA